MKKFKISFVAIAALVIAVTTAFTTKPHERKSTDPFYYSYSESTSANLMDDSKWFVAPSPEEGCSSEVDINCTIHLNDGPRNLAGNPDFSAAGISSPTVLNSVTDNWKPSE